MSQRSILLVHGNEVGWTDIRQTLLSIGGVSIVGDVVTGPEAIRIATRFHPDIVLASTKLGDESSALSTLVQLREGPCSASTIGVFAAWLSPQSELAELVKIGIAGYFIWADLLYATLRESLRALLTGGLFLCSHTAARILIPVWPRQGDRKQSISMREMTILRGLAVGLTEAALARRLRCNERTVRYLISGLEEKLGASTLFTLGMHATVAGLIP